MAEYNTVNAKVSDSQLNKPKNAVKNKQGTTLKLVSANFYQIFISSPNDSPSKTMKNVFYFI